MEKGARKSPAGSLLFSFKLTVGSVAFLEKSAYTNEAIAAFEPNSHLDLRFWAYAAPIFIPKYGRENIYGALLLNQELISSVRYVAPKIAEQEQIAAFLDHETGKIDALIEEQRRLIELLKEKRQAVISHAVTKGLDPNVPMKDPGVEWLGEVPAHWDVVPLGLLARKIQTGPFGSQLHSHEYVEGGVPVINPSSIVDGCIVPDKRSTVGRVVVERLNHHKLVENELVVGRRGEMGRCAVVSCKEAGWLCGTGSMKVSLSERVDPWFLSHFMRIPLVRGLLQLESVGSTMDNLNPELLSRVRVPIPPIAEQRHLVARIEENADQTSRLINEAVKGSELLLGRRSSLISAAVTGKIDVRGWSAGAEAEEPGLAMVAEESAGYSAQGGAQ